MRTLLAAALMVSLALAGCASDSGPQETQAIQGKVDEEEFVLEVGKGAISGLLVDDRFRPIELTDDPQTEFQTSGFILLQELGLRSQTDANGQFTFVDIEPGTYTIRVTADGHEAIPQKIRVEEGVFNEIDLLARRIVSEGNFIVTEEYSFFAPCAASVIATTVIFGCFDASGDNYRPGPQLNYSALDASYMVIEYLTDSEGNYNLQVRGSSVFCNIYTEGSRYGSAVFKVSEDEVYDEQCANPWPNDRNFEAIAFYAGDVANPLEGSGAPVGSGKNGVGAATSTAAKVIVSVFIGEPDIDLANYRLLDESSS